MGRDWSLGEHQPNILVVSQSHEEQLFALLSESRLRAVHFVRQTYGVGLQEAMEFVASFQREHFELVEHGRGMSIRVYAIGPYDTSLADAMPYAPEYYADVTPGRQVVVWTLDLYRSPIDRVRAICAALGIDDPEDIAQHAIDSRRIDRDALVQALADAYEETADQVREEVEDLLRLVAAGFALYLRVDEWSAPARAWVVKESCPWA